MKLLFTASLFLGLIFNSYGQTDKEKAYDIAMGAIKIMDEGKIDESIKMLKESQKLDPENFNYPYEIGYAYYIKKDYKNAIKVLNKVIEYENNSPESFALLGNAYDMNQQPEKAIEVYNSGLTKFPSSGRLYYELGNVQEVLKEYENALDSWEKGITVNPTYHSNYHNAAIYFCKYSTEKLWGVIYGELFMNIERGSERTAKISKLLFDTYKAAITIKSETEAGVSFSKSMQMSLPKDGEEIKLPFSMPFEMTMVFATTSELEEKELGIKSFNNIRTSFIINWYENNRNIEYPNILFDWHKNLIDLGYFESYNYWLLMKGNEEEFDNWYNKNKEQYDQFIAWFSDNPLSIDEQNKFHRTQYN